MRKKPPDPSFPGADTARILWCLGKSIALDVFELIMHNTDAPYTASVQSTALAQSTASARPAPCLPALRYTTIASAQHLCTTASAHAASAQQYTAQHPYYSTSAPSMHAYPPTSYHPSDDDHDVPAPTSYVPTSSIPVPPQHYHIPVLQVNSLAAAPLGSETESANPSSPTSTDYNFLDPFDGLDPVEFQQMLGTPSGEGTYNYDPYYNDVDESAVFDTDDPYYGYSNDESATFDDDDPYFDESYNDEDASAASYDDDQSYD